MKDKSAEKQRGFSRSQVSEDTENAMRGRPQKYGAADDAEEPDDSNMEHALDSQSEPGKPPDDGQEVSLPAHHVRLGNHDAQLGDISSRLAELERRSGARSDGQP